MKLNVYATPDNLADKELRDKVVVVIDVLRATSTIQRPYSMAVKR